MYIPNTFLIFVSVAAAFAQPQFSSNLTGTCIISDFSHVDYYVPRCTDIVISNLRVPANKELVLNLKTGTKLTFEGTTSFDFGTLNDWLLTISGNRITVVGAKGSVIHGHGELYWDGHGGAGGKTKPKLLQILNVNQGTFTGISLKNCPMFCTGITKATDLTINGFKADCSAGDKLGKNTDGIGISWSKNVQITDAVIHNQDQCLYVNQGSNMHFNKIHCIGSNGICATAGFSATSYEENTTKNISFHNSVLEGGLTGVQIIAMANPGGPGVISDITFQNIVLKGVRQQGIYVQMDFGNDGHPNNELAVKNINMKQITGTVEKGAKAVYIKCGSKCANWNFSGVKITGSQVPNSCNYQPNGFNC